MIVGGGQAIRMPKTVLLGFHFLLRRLGKRDTVVAASDGMAAWKPCEGLVHDDDGSSRFGSR